MREGGRVVEVGKDEIEAVVGSNMISLCPLPPPPPRGNIGALRQVLPSLPPSCGVDGLKDDGFTALHLAALNNHLEAAQALLQHVREGGGEGGRDGERERGREGGQEGGREGEREGGKEGWRERGREAGREGGR